jgi:myo-inositol-1(or 4)-monophosphatase
MVILPDNIPATYPYLRELITAIELAQKAGDLLLEIHQMGPTQINSKQSAVDIVTEADTASQALILETIIARFPEHDILAEEAGWDKSTGARALWVVDPLDGTTNFASRFPVFAVSIAMWVEGVPTIGVVQDVVRERTYWAARGQGAWAGPRGRLHESRLQVSQASELNQSLIATGFPYVRATTEDNNRAECSYLVPRVRGVRRAGSAALDLAWVAEGRLDGYWESYVHPWDWGAGVLLIAEAGGTISNYQGAAWQASDSKMVAANPALHPKLLSAIQTARHQAGFA